MACTLVCIISLVFNIILLTGILFLGWKYFQKNKQNKSLVGELNSDSLEHYLSEIKKRGYEFTLKPGKKKTKD